MITDESGRFALAPVGNRLWRYDGRWRTSDLIDVGESPVYFSEGAAALAVTTKEADHISVEVRIPESPDDVPASAIYDGTHWEFLGDSQFWAAVPDYVLLAEGDGQQMLRLADDAELDPLEGIGPVHQVVDVPASRLVMLAGAGIISVYDPIARRVLRHFELAEKNPQPVIRFHDADEVWINDLTTMLKLDAKKFEVIDAAGSETGISPSEAGEEGEKKTALGRFEGWTFAAGNELCVVTRPELGDALVLDTVSMLPVAQATFLTGAPIDATLVRRNILIATTADGLALRARVRKVKPQH
jgi:hypothetical protein